MTTKKYPFDFQVNSTDCCGMLHMSGVAQEEYDRYSWGGNRKSKNPFKTNKELFADFDKKLKEKIQSCISGDGGYQGGYLVSATFVTAYGKNNYSDKRAGSKEHARLQAHLLKTGWEITKEWTNSNSSNKVGLFTKYFDHKDDLDDYNADNRDEDYDDDF